MMQNTSGLVERSLTFIEIYRQYKSKEDIMQILIHIKIRQKDSAFTSLVIDDIMS